MGILFFPEQRCGSYPLTNFRAKWLIQHGLIQGCASQLFQTPDRQTPKTGKLTFFRLQNFLFRTKVAYSKISTNKLPAAR